MNKNLMITKLLLAFLLISVGLYSQTETPKVVVGAERLSGYLPNLEGKKVGVVTNHTGMVGETHLVDTLRSLGVEIVKVFAPEHGFRGEAEAGAKISNEIDSKTGIPIVSLYGKKNKPSLEDMQNIEKMIFDIQDVGCRFYTYISTLHYVMEACAEKGIELIVLDRPNPNAYYIDGPVLDTNFRSFVGMHPVPIVYGMTIGEYAQMIKGEKWIAKSSSCYLTILPIENYNHNIRYELPIAPSPNLPTMSSIYLYPSLCLFEGTDVSVGRGTDNPFEVIGFPELQIGNHEFTPKTIKGKSENPPHNNKKCKGFHLKAFSDSYLKFNGEIYLYWLKGMYEEFPNKDLYFNDFFDKLAGTDELRLQIRNGVTIDEIKKSWKPDLENFKMIRNKYLLY